MRRRRRRKKNRGVYPAILTLLAVTAVSWWMYQRDPADLSLEANTLAALPAQTSPQPAPEPPPGAAPATAEPSASTSPQPSAPDSVPERSVTPLGSPTPATPAVSNASPTPSANTLVDEGKQAMARGDLIAARQSLNKALASGLDEATAKQLRDDLAKINSETVFSGRILPGDSLVGRYVIKAGDSLAKIASQHAVTADLLASINGIEDKNRIREGQALKVINGPLRVVVYKRAYRLDVYAGDVYVRSFPVGLGLDDSTPTGEWRVKNKLENPTYYPPRGGAIVSADDPANPLGERWIGLEGVSGEALSQERYGVHGTNEPDSIGKSVSLGCVRLHNADVEQLYTYLIEGKSTVTIVE